MDLKPARILLIDETGVYASILQLWFLRAHYAVALAAPAEALSVPPPDLVLLNSAVLPAGQLAVLLSRLHSRPLIVVSRRPSLGEKLSALEMGADDYLGWPFHLKELVLRARNLLRRVRESEASKLLEMGPVRMDRARRQVFLEGEPLHLTTRQFELLLYFFENPRRFIGRDELLNHVWNLPTPVETNIVETTMNTLRRKLKDHGKRLICTLRGGYCMGEVIQRGKKEA